MKAAGASRCQPGVAVYCITWFQTQLILTACQIPYHAFVALDSSEPVIPRGYLEYCGVSGLRHHFGLNPPPPPKKRKQRVPAAFHLGVFSAVHCGCLRDSCSTILSAWPLCIIAADTTHPAACLFRAYLFHSELQGDTRLLHPQLADLSSLESTDGWGSQMQPKLPHSPHCVLFALSVVAVLVSTDWYRY